MVFVGLVVQLVTAGEVEHAAVLADEVVGQKQNVYLVDVRTQLAVLGQADAVPAGATDACGGASTVIEDPFREMMGRSSVR